jgi:RNA polymerase sigma-70 factor (ECF subfamily)
MALRLPLGRNRPGCLLQAAKSDPDAFAEFYEQYIRRVIAFLLRRTFDPELALDLAAETFATALLRRHDFRGSTEEQERAWLFAIARTQLSHYVRRGQVERRAVRRLGIMTTSMAPDEIARIEEMAGLADLKSRLVGALDALAPEQRQAVELRVLSEFDYRRIAQEMNSTEEVARARVSRGLRMLARQLDSGDPLREEVA